MGDAERDAEMSALDDLIASDSGRAASAPPTGLDALIASDYAGAKGQAALAPQSAGALTDTSTAISSGGLSRPLS